MILGAGAVPDRPALDDSQAANNMPSPVMLFAIADIGSATTEKTNGSSFFPDIAQNPGLGPWQTMISVVDYEPLSFWLWVADGVSLMGDPAKLTGLERHGFDLLGRGQRQSRTEEAQAGRQSLPRTTRKD
ncbi:MAG: hypothetical protein HC871_09790 [Rhizobiales bacterium]|nr:hypothetical protein [Hyphomicrobiales bacterium]